MQAVLLPQMMTPGQAERFKCESWQYRTKLFQAAGNLCSIPIFKLFFMMADNAYFCYQKCRDNICCAVCCVSVLMWLPSPPTPARLCAPSCCPRWLSFPHHHHTSFPKIHHERSHLGSAKKEKGHKRLTNSVSQRLLD